MSGSPKQSNISKKIFVPDSENVDDEDDEDDDKSVLEIKCSRKDLSKLCKATINRKSAILDNGTENYFVRKLEPVLCSIIELP
jgi:hypothetical protein